MDKKNKWIMIGMIFISIALPVSAYLFVNGYFDLRNRAADINLDSVSRYGTGRDGSCTVAANTNINSGTCAGRENSGDAVNFSVTNNVSSGSGSVTLSSAPTGLAVNDEILIINLRGVPTSTGYSYVGQYETAYITEIDGNTLTLHDNLTNGYNGTNQKIMVQRIPQFTNVTVNAGVSWYPTAWNNTKGGVLAFKATGTVNILGTIHANISGFAGAPSRPYGGNGSLGGNGGDSFCGNGGVGGEDGGAGGAGAAGGGGSGKSSVYGGGGTGYCGGGGATCTTMRDSGIGSSNSGGSGGGGSSNSGGGGGGYGSIGYSGWYNWDDYGSDGGTNASGNGVLGGGGGGGTYGVANLSKLYLGSGGGGGGGAKITSFYTGEGGYGGGIILVIGNDISISGAITNSGGGGGRGHTYGGVYCNTGAYYGGGGGGSGGSIKIVGDTINVGTIRVTAGGGAGGTGSWSANCDGSNGGAGGSGRIAGEYYETFTGTTSPSINLTDLSGECTDLWWFDNDSTECEYNEFCGDYTYEGLETFDTEEECETSFNEKKLCEYADLNDDGKVNMSDYTLFVNDYMDYRDEGIYNEKSDFNDDEKVNMSDYMLFVECYLDRN